MSMDPPRRLDDLETPRGTLGGILAKRCARCRRGAIFRSTWVMNDDCPECGLDFDRGDPGYFTGAMYVSYALAIPVIALLTLIGYLIVAGWSLFRLVAMATVVALPFVPWLWQYSRVIWIYFDQYFDPERDDQADVGESLPDGPGRG
jgi:uncharacterized protein (DUF983 family)